MEDMELLEKTKDVVSLADFYKMWREAFEYCRIRKTKNVAGKCNTCATLGGLRATMKSVGQREEIRALCFAHRTMYMGERDAYYKRRSEAIRNPDKYISLITDGMAQCHCQLPW
jgi:hypothetical protein